MSEVKLVPFDPHHVQVMDIRDFELKSSFALDDIYERLKEVLKGPGEAGTFIYEGRILCCAGFKIIWPGVIEGWIIPSIYIKDAPVSFAKYMRRYVESVAKTFNCHRFQTASPDDAFHERWMNWMGFQKEGVMRKYTHDQKNYGLYSRLF